MVALVRTRQLRWWTEEGGRGWARRFTVWLGAKPVEESQGEGISQYLEYPAVEEKASARVPSIRH